MRQKRLRSNESVNKAFEANPEAQNLIRLSNMKAVTPNLSRPGAGKPPLASMNKDRFSLQKENTLKLPNINAKSQMHNFFKNGGTS